MLSPFSDIKTNEMPIEKIIEYFVPPQNLGLIYSPHAMFIEGQRGTGKTTLMRYISKHPVWKDDTLEYLGVYLRFDRPTFSSRILTDEEYTDIFSHYLVTILLIKTMRQIKNFYSENDFNSFDTIAMTITHIFYSDVEIYNMDGILNFLEYQRMHITKYIRNKNTTSKPNIADYCGCFERLMEAFHNEPKFYNLNILFLLDEFENLNGKQQSVINAFIKTMEYGYSFKVFHRPLGRENAQILDSNEYLKERDDYVVLDFYEDIIGGDSAFPGFIIDLCRKRLQYHYDYNDIVYEPEHLEISYYLDIYSDDDEFDEYSKNKKYMTRIRNEIKKLISIYPEDDIKQLVIYIDGLDDLFILRLFLMLITKLDLHPLEIKDHLNSKSVRYNNWVHNYKKSILFLVCYENNKKKIVSGINEIINISGNITRYVLNILHYIFANEDNNNSIYKRFTPSHQTQAINKVSEIAFKDISNIPNLGVYLRTLINYIGNIFLLYHKDKVLKEWEVNHFVITPSSKKIAPEVTKSLNDILLAAITWGIIISDKNTKAKSKEEFVEDFSTYSLHPIFSVYFYISYRKKQKCYFPQDELCDYIFGDLLTQKEIYKAKYKKILNADVSDWDQISLFKGEIY